MTLCAFADERLAYGDRTVLDAVSLSFRPGERLVLIGRSGAGKSTLLSAIHGRLVDRGERVSLVPQDHALVPQLSVHHNVRMGRLEDHGAVYNLVSLVRPFAADRAAVRSILEEVGLAAEAGRAVETLSGGQKQRTAIARAFHRGGSVLIGDEPLSAVDGQQGRALLGRIEARFPTTVLAMHDVELALAHASRVIGLARGRLAFDLPPHDVRPELIDELYRT